MTIPLVSHNPINGGKEEKEGTNRRDRVKRGREWKNCKGRGGFGDGWDCCLLAVILAS